MNKDFTQEWQELTTGQDYNNRLNLYHKTELNWNMYNGNQWIGIKLNGLAKWTFNICKSAINYFVASIMSQKIKLKYSAENIPDEPKEGSQEEQIKQFTDLMSEAADLKWEKDKMDSKLRQLLLDGAVTGDMCAYVYWDPNKETGQDEKGDFTTELVDGVNVMFGNPNNPNVEAQPYILITGRDMVSNLKKEAKENKIPQEDIDTITADTETQYQAGQNGKIELDNKDESGKCQYVIKLYKKDGQVSWNKSTKYCPIRKDIAMGIKRYPVAWANWDRIKNSYHGMAAIEGIIDNQISINQLFAITSYWMKINAFGKLIYDGTAIPNWSNKVGEAIKANGPVNDGVFKQLQAGNFNAAVLSIIEMAVKYTKEFIGANDLAQVNPEQASGISIMASAKEASIPLENPQANIYQFVEDLGLIWGEFMLRKYKNRKLPIKRNGQIQVVDYNTEGITDLIIPLCSVDVGPSSYYSEIAGVQTLDNLFSNNRVTPKQYFERMAKLNIIPDCQGLLDDIQEQEDKLKEYETMAQIIETMVPPELQPQAMQMIQAASMPQQPNMGNANVLPQ